ncbi:MAG: GNAT family N-acetyltransferase [Sphingomicrobium sp.]
MTTIQVRAARLGDEAAIEALVAELDHRISADQVRRNLDALDRDGLPQLVADLDGRIVGLAGLDRMTALYRIRPVGRITILVVAADMRGRGIGRLLVETAVDTARNWGCGMIEVTSNERLQDAHAYYRHLGFEQTSRRFALTLD